MANDLLTLPGESRKSLATKYFYSETQFFCVGVQVEIWMVRGGWGGYIYHEAQQ